jgi:UDP-glucuronate decarboxylase
MELAQKVQQKIGQADIAYKPMPGDDPKQRCPDISAAQKYLGWQPRIPLDQGLEKTIPWFRQTLGVQGR